MHHPREAVIDGVQFVLIREDLLEEVKDAIGELRIFMVEKHASYDKYARLVELSKSLGEL